MLVCVLHGVVVAVLHCVGVWLLYWALVFVCYCVALLHWAWCVAVILGLVCGCYLRGRYVAVTLELVCVAVFLEGLVLMHTCVTFGLLCGCVH